MCQLHSSLMRNCTGLYMVGSSNQVSGEKNEPVVTLMIKGICDVSMTTGKKDYI